MSDRVQVLCVDDEPHILEGLALLLRRGYEVIGATSGAAGLDELAARGPFAVVLSDMRMPGMDGAAFLGEVRRLAPDTTRMLLTGHADMNAAVTAVNEGQIFRFLLKPCPPDKLRLAFDAAVEQHRLVTAERVLLEQTLQGSIKTLIDILALTSPAAFGRATRIKQHASELLDALAVEQRWPVEMAAMLHPLGSISLPEETAEKLYHGLELSDDEQAMVADMPRVTEELLANIPRLEPVRAILRALAAPPAAADGDRRERPPGAEVLEIAAAFDTLESQGLSPRLALDSMLGRDGVYDPQALLAFAELKGATADEPEVREIPLKAIRAGMIMAEDVRTTTGLLLVARGYEVTASFMAKARHFKKGLVKEPLRVVVKARR